MSYLSISSNLVISPIYKQPPIGNRLKLPSYNHLTYGLSMFSLHRSPLHLSIKASASNARNLVSCAAVPSEEEGEVAVADFGALGEKDWSFLESDSINSKTERANKIAQIISAGNVLETSDVLVSIGSEDFIDQLEDSCDFLVLVHDALLPLACLMEKYEEITYWQGELIKVPETWAPFDVVFLYFLPGLPFKLDQIFKALASRCSPGARVVISHMEGRRGLELQRKQHSDVVLSDLPDKTSLEKVGSANSFSVKEYVDDPFFYLAVLEFKA